MLRGLFLLAVSGDCLTCHAIPPSLLLTLLTYHIHYQSEPGPDITDHHPNLLLLLSSGINSFLDQFFTWTLLSRFWESGCMMFSIVFAGKLPSYNWLQKFSQLQTEDCRNYVKLAHTSLMITTIQYSASQLTIISQEICFSVSRPSLGSYSYLIMRHLAQIKKNADRELHQQSRHKTSRSD